MKYTLTITLPVGASLDIAIAALMGCDLGGAALDIIAVALVE